MEGIADAQSLAGPAVYCHCENTPALNLYRNTLSYLKVCSGALDSNTAHTYTPPPATSAANNMS